MNKYLDVLTKLSPTELKVLEYIDKVGAVYQSMVAKEFNITQSYASKILVHLVSLKLVKCIKFRRYKLYYKKVR